MNEFSPQSDRGDHLDLLLATSEIGIWELDVATGKALRNLRHDQIFGHEELLDEWSGDIFLAYVHSEHRERIGSLLANAVNGGQPWSFEAPIRRADGVDRWISAKGMPKFSEDGQVTKLIGHVIDITQTKHNEDRLKLLSKELNHRVANTFTIMNSMIRHGAKETTSVEEFAEGLMSRLASLARSNRVLIANEAERSSLQEIIRVELDAFANWQQRVIVNGSGPVWFSGPASEALALIFHELLTNAVKHGALSNTDGSVTVNITRTSDQETYIDWVEHGGPATSVEPHSGIGSTILRNAMRDEGKVTLDFAPGGLNCHIVVNESFQREVPHPSIAPRQLSPVEQSATDTTALLSGKRVLIVEDDPIIGLDISEILLAAGARPIGPCRNVASALKAIGDLPDAALLDINLGSETSESVALRLAEMAIPFITLSGQLDTGGLDDQYANAPRISKPFGETELLLCLTKILQ